MVSPHNRQQKRNVGRVADLVESTAILGDNVQLTAECRERSAIDRVGVRCAEHVRARGMDRGVDHECGGVEQAERPRFIEDVAFVVDEDEILGLDE